MKPLHKALLNYLIERGWIFIYHSKFQFMVTKGTKKCYVEDESSTMVSFEYRDKKLASKTIENLLLEKDNLIKYFIET